MNKKYIQPTIQVAIIYHQSHLLAGSLGNVNSTKANGLGVDDLTYEEGDESNPEKPEDAW